MLLLTIAGGEAKFRTARLPVGVSDLESRLSSLLLLSVRSRSISRLRPDTAAAPAPRSTMHVVAQFGCGEQPIQTPHTHAAPLLLSPSTLVRFGVRSAKVKLNTCVLVFQVKGLEMEESFIYFIWCNLP